MDANTGLLRKPDTRKIDAFKLWLWRRLLRMPDTARRGQWTCYLNYIIFPSLQFMARRQT
jgi:hypothetical protein